MTGAAPAGAEALAAEVAADFDRLPRGSVLVLGDTTLDRRVHGTADRGCGIFRLGHEHAEPGGAATLVGILAGFGVATALISVLGDDLAGAELTALIGAQSNVEPWLLVDAEKSTVTETHYVGADGATLFRTMREDMRPMAPKLRDRMLRIAGDAMAATSLTVLSDRGHGTLDVEAATSIVTRSRQSGRRVVADVERLRGLEARYRGFDLVLRLSDAEANADRGAEAASLREAAETGAAILFLPEGGCVLADREGIERAECAAPDGIDAAYALFVAGVVGALATGRSVRRALLVGAYAIRRGAPPDMTR